MDRLGGRALEYLARRIGDATDQAAKDSVEGRA